MRGPEEYDGVPRALEDDNSDVEGGSEISGGSGRVFESPLGRFCFRGEDFLGCRILYLGFPFPEVVVGGGTGIGTGVAVLEVSAELGKEDGPLMEDMERGSNGFPGFPFHFASSCAFANLYLAV